MKKNLLKGILACLFLSAGAAAATAAEYLPMPETTPANNQIATGYATSISLAWSEELQDAPVLQEGATGAQTNITDAEASKITILLNGVKQNYGTGMGNGSLYLTHIQKTKESGGSTGMDDEATGKGTVSDLYGLKIDLPDMAFFWSKGKLEINIPEGIVTSVDGAINPEINLTYYSLEGVDGTWTWDIESGQSFEYGECIIKATLPYSEEVTVNTNPAKPDNYAFIQYVNDEGDTSDQIGVAQYMKVEGNTLTFDFSQFPGGNYTMTIPEGVVFVGSDGMNYQQTVPGFSIKTPVNPTLPPVAVEPVKDTEVEELSTVTVNWFYSTLNLNESNTTPISVTLDGEPFTGNFETYLEFSQVAAEVEGYEGNQLVIDFSNLQLANGVYEITVPAGYVMVSDLSGAGELPNEEVKAKYTVFMPTVTTLQTNPTVSPESGSTLNSLNLITLTWNMDIELNDENPEAATLNGVELEGAVEDQILIFEFDTINSGEVTLVVPECYLLITDEDGSEYYNKKLILTYTIGNTDEPGGGVTPPVTSGVESIDAENGVNVIYNLQGIKVNSNNVPAGIYIINGKKVVLK